MIKRYTPKLMGAVWEEQRKFQAWLDVELAVVYVRVQGGKYAPGTYPVMKEKASFTVEGIEKRELITEHDMIAFVEEVRASLPTSLAQFFHDGLTSYDVEVPALALQFGEAGKILLADLDLLIAAVHKQASIHLNTYGMGSTHGQDAEPTKLVWRLCGYLDMLRQSRERLYCALDAIRQVKCSGAVATWATIPPSTEDAVIAHLQLDVRPAPTQIVPRDVFASFLSEVAVLGGCIEKIATDLRLLATSGYREVEEPRKPGQKGSSAMPHKKNPILLERMCGMAILLRAYASAGQETIRTWLERDIAHSSVERVIFADATCVLDYMLQKMTWIMDGLVVFRDRMVQGIDRSRGCWASEHVKLAMCAKGLDTDEVYKYLQACAFAAFEHGTTFKHELCETGFGEDKLPIQSILTKDELDHCFDFVSQLVHITPMAIERFGIDVSLALPPNFPPPTQA